MAMIILYLHLNAVFINIDHSAIHFLVMFVDIPSYLHIRILHICIVDGPIFFIFILEFSC